MTMPFHVILGFWAAEQADMVVRTCKEAACNLGSKTAGSRKQGLQRGTLGLLLGLEMLLPSLGL